MMIPQTSPYTPQPPALGGRAASTIIAHKKPHALGAYDCGVFALLALASSLVACNMPAPSVPAPVAIAKVAASPTEAPSESPLATAQKHRPDAALAGVVAGKRYPVTANLPFQLELPDGQAMDGVLHPRQILTSFADYGIRFQYPADMKLSAKENPLVPIHTLHLEAADATRVQLQIHAEPTTAEMALAQMVYLGQKACAKNGGTPAGTGTPTRRRIRDANVEGRALACSFGGLETKVELYALQKEDKVITLELQPDGDDPASAMARFEVIADTLQ